MCGVHSQSLPIMTTLSPPSATLIAKARAGTALSDEEALALADCDDLAALMAAASELRDHFHGAVVSYSRKVFIPLTQLCRDSCHYCTFATPPRRGERAYLTPDAVLAIAKAGTAAGCREALFTLGDKPELRYRAAREELAAARLRQHDRLSRGHGGAGAAGDGACCRISIPA